MASFAALSWLVHGGCTAGNVNFCPFGPMLFVVWHALGPGHQEDSERTRRERAQEEGRRKPEGGQEEGP